MPQTLGVLAWHRLLGGAPVGSAAAAPLLTLLPRMHKPPCCALPFSPQPLLPDENRPNGLRSVAHVIAVSSCKGGELWGEIGGYRRAAWCLG